MTHLTDEELHSLPEADGEAFVAGERIMRDRLNTAISEQEGYDNNNTDHLTLSYMNNVIALAANLGIAEIANWEYAKPGHHAWHQFSTFAADVDACTMRLRIAHVRRAKEYSVLLDANAKKKFGRLLDELRSTVEKLEISDAKRQRLLARINALQAEIDRERTRYEVFAALMIEAADDVGEAAKRLEPAVQLLERIGAAFGSAKRSEPQQKQLPPASKPKQIEGPKAPVVAKKKNGFDKALDDEIPF